MGKHPPWTECWPQQQSQPRNEEVCSYRSGSRCYSVDWNSDVDKIRYVLNWAWLCGQAVRNYACLSACKNVGSEAPNAGVIVRF